MKKILIIILVQVVCFNLQAQTKVRVMPHWLNQAQFSGFYMAYEKGFYEKYGLELEILGGGPQSPMNRVFKNNETEFGSMFLSGAIELQDQGVNIFNICQLSQKSALMFVSKKSSGIDNIEDFNGKKIGVWRSDFKELPLAFIDKFSIDAEIVPINSTINLFLDDGIDVMCVMWYNEYDQIYNSGIDYEDLNTFFLFDYDLNIPEDGLYCSQEFYLENPEACSSFAKATLEGWQYAFANPNETINIVMQYMKKDNIPANRAHQQWMLSVIEKVYTNDAGIISGELKKEDFIKTSSLLLNSGYISEMPVFEEFVR